MALHQRGLAWLSDKLPLAAGRAVTYRRGQDTVAITATATMTTYSLPGEDGLLTQVHSYDWVVSADDLVISGVEFTPRPGDRIEETLSGETVIWEIMDMESRPCIEWLDTSGIMLLLHSKQVS